MQCASQRRIHQVNLLALVLGVLCLAAPLQTDVDSTAVTNAPSSSSHQLTAIASSSAPSASSYNGLSSSTISYSSLTTSVAWCYDMDALRSLEGDDVQNSYGMYGFDGVLNNYYIYVTCSFGLAFLLIFVMLVAVCLRDYRAGVRGHERDHSSEDLPLSVITSRASDGRYNASLSGSRTYKLNRLLRNPQRFSRALRRRHTQRSSSTSTTRTHLADSYDVEANAVQPVNSHESVHRDTSQSSLAAPAAAIDTHLAVLAPRVPTESSHEHRNSGRSVSFSGRALGPRHGIRSPIESQFASTSTPSDSQQRSNQPTSSLDESDVAAVDALEIEHGVAQPPAYIASVSRAQPSSSRPFSDRGKARAVSPESPADNQRWLAHIATDDKSVLSELRYAASAPLPNLHPLASNVPVIPSNSVSEEDRMPSAPMMDSTSTLGTGTEPSAPTLERVSRMPSAPILDSTSNLDSAPSLADAPFLISASNLASAPVIASAPNLGDAPISDGAPISDSAPFPTSAPDLASAPTDPLALNEPSNSASQIRVDMGTDSPMAPGLRSMDGGRDGASDRLDTTATSAAHEKQAEADAEIAHLRALLPSVPTEYRLSSESLPLYGVTPSAPADILGAAYEPLNMEHCFSHIDDNVNDSSSDT